MLEDVAQVPHTWVPPVEFLCEGRETRILRLTLVEDAKDVANSDQQEMTIGVLLMNVGNPIRPIRMGGDRLWCGWALRSTNPYKPGLDFPFEREFLLDDEALALFQSS